MTNFLIDISLSPSWIGVFREHGWSATHWSSVGDPRARDSVLMSWARENHFVVFTHDLDFGTMLALTRARGPSVVQVRSHDVLPENLQTPVVAAIGLYESELEHGAILTIDEGRHRIRMLPIKRGI